MRSNDLMHCKHKGLPPNLYELIQELGRVNRQLRDLPGTNTYEVHASVDSHASLFVRIMTCPDAAERRNLLRSMQEVLALLFDPSGDCYHTAIELYFELEPQQSKIRCQHYCSNCRGEVKQQTGLFYKDRLVSILLSKAFLDGNSPHYKALIKTIKEHKDFIFHPKHVPTTKMGPIHALVLQLLSKGILGLGVNDIKKIGKKSLSTNNVTMTLPFAINEEGMKLPAYFLTQKWVGMNMV